MRIVIARRDYLDSPDGIGIFIFSLADALMEAGHEVTVVGGLRVDEEKIRSSFPCRRWPEVLSLDIAPDASPVELVRQWMTRGKGLINRIQPAWVVMNGAVPVRPDAPVCVVSHDLERRKANWGPARIWYKRWAYGRADVVVATCTELAHGLAAELSIPPESITVIPTCVPLNPHGIGVKQDRTSTILHLGTADYKNPAASIRALAATTTHGARLAITGRMNPGVENALSEIPPECRTRVDVLGFISSESLRQLLGSVAVLSVPSIYDYPVASPTVLDGFASGTPVVTTKSVSRDLVRDGVNAFVADPSRPNEYAAALDRLLQLDDDWSAASRAAWASAEAFSSERVAQKYLDLFSSAKRTLAAAI